MPLASPLRRTLLASVLALLSALTIVAFPPPALLHQDDGMAGKVANTTLQPSATGATVHPA